jgi:hypothetical protein
VRPRHAEGVQHRDRVRGQLGDPVRVLVEAAGGAAGVAVVVAQHPMPLGEAGDEIVRPGPAGRVRAHDQQQRLVPSRAGARDLLGPEPDPVRDLDVAMHALRVPTPGALGRIGSRGPSARVWVVEMCCGSYFRASSRA